MKEKIFLFLTLATTLKSTECNRLKDRIYKTLKTDTIHSCFRRLNGTTTIGCSSSVRGEVGVLMYVDSVADVEKLNDATFGPYIVLLNPQILSGDLIQQLEDTGHLTGVILPSVEDPQGLWYNKTPPGGFSDDSQAGGWNKAGSGLLWRHFEFPIFYLPDSETTEQLYQCYKDYNNKTLAWPLCSVEMKANMHAATDSKTCTRRSNLNNNLEPVQFCDPLADINIHYSVGKTASKVLVVTARLDTLTMFDQTEVGFDSPATGLVTFLSAANLVATALRSSGGSVTGKVDSLLFLLLNGESFDNIGSSRFLYDLKQGKFVTNITLDKVDTVLELGQLSNLESDTVYLHSVNNPQDVVSSLESQASSQGLTAVQSSSASLPPSSSSKLVSELPHLPAVVVTNFDSEFSNKYYHSLYDTARHHGYNISLGPGQSIVQHLSKISVVVARTVLSLATDADPDSVSAQPDLVNEMLQCYSVSANCSMFKESSRSDTGFPWSGPQVSRPWPQYVGVNVSPHAKLTKQLLQLLTGTKVELEQEETEPTDKAKHQTDWERQTEKCLAARSDSDPPEVSYVYLVGPGCYNHTTVHCGHCYRTSVSHSEATSPAFIKVTSDHSYQDK